MVTHLKAQEADLNSIVKRIEPWAGSKQRVALLTAKYFAKVIAISVFFGLLWDSVYPAVYGEDDKKTDEERLSTAVQRAFWDVLPSPFYGADPSKFFATPVAPNFQRSAPFGRTTRRGLTTDIVSYGTSVRLGVGLVDRISNRRLSRGLVDLISPKKEKEKQP
ncbi:MAG: hypothetical protein ABR568_00730 [Pyrinomonadaceae bacterium]